MTKEEPFTTALMQLDVPLIVLSSWSNLTKDAVTEQLAAWVKSHSPVNGSQCVAAGTCWWRPSNKIFAPFWLCAISKAALVPASRNWCTLERIRTFMQSMKT
ncbi:MAG: hypothetical protein EOO65_00165 [Methanosarcinales archaeon]|nr:MAG: hypothetical protein EOO65_00165 [Methanosarcinales archaeon]